MGLFNKNQSAAAPGSERQLLANKYSSARGNILMVVIWTAINILLLVSNSSTYFLFSAFIPYFLLEFGMFYCGKYPAELYSEYYNEMEFLPNSVFWVLLAIAVILLAFYVLCWVLSKKFGKGWLIAALVFFCIDTLAMFYFVGFAVDSLIDYAIHGWVIYSFVRGIIAYSKLKKLPDENEQQEDILVVDSEPATQEEQLLE